MSADRNEQDWEPAAVQDESRLTFMNEDVLAYIFHFLAIDDKMLNLGGWDWVIIGSVCRRWHAVADGTPRLWSYIYSWKDYKRTLTFLRLSRYGDLTVDFSVQSVKVSSEEGRVLKISAGAILRELQRISFLRLPLYLMWMSDFAHLLQQPAPRMRQIHLYNIEPPRDCVVSLPEMNGALQSVSLKGIRPSSDICCLKDLTEVYLRFEGLLLSNLIPMLLNCPKLTSLSIWTKSHFSTLHIPDTTVQLSSLRYLSIILPDASSINSFLRSIAVPRLSC